MGRDRFFNGTMSTVKGEQAHNSDCAFMFVDVNGSVMKYKTKIQHSDGKCLVTYIFFFLLMPVMGMRKTLVSRLSMLVAGCG